MRVCLVLVLLLAALLAGPSAGAQPNVFWQSGVDFPGGTFLTFDLRGNDPVLCQRLCAEHAQCRAFSYAQPTSGALGRCELKRSASVPAPSALRISGVKPYAGAVGVAEPIPGVQGLPQGGSPTDFAIGALRARPVVPVLVLIVRRTDLIAANGRVIRNQLPADLGAAFFDNFVFAPAVNSVSDYLYSASNNRFQPVKAGILGPVTVNWPAGTLTEDMVVETADAMGFDFTPFDRNLDGQVDASELVILAVENNGGGLAAARSACLNTDERKLRADGSRGAKPLVVCGINNVTIAGWDSTVLNVAHELAHAIGAFDLYGKSGACWNLTFSLMSCTAGPVDPRQATSRLTYDFDPFHKIAFGWSIPRLVRADQSGYFLLNAAQSLDDGPVLLWDPRSNRGEFWLLEHRSASLGGIDQLAGQGIGPPRGGLAEGLVVWYVRYDPQTGVRFYPSQILPGVNGLQTFVAGDDQPRDGDGDGVIDGIDPGPNAVLDSIAARADVVIQPAQVFVGVAPSSRARSVDSQNEAGQLLTAFRVGTVGLRLQWFDDSDVGVRIDVERPAGAGPGTIAVRIRQADDPTLVEQVGVRVLSPRVLQATTPWSAAPPPVNVGERIVARPETGRAAAPAPVSPDVEAKLAADKVLEQKLVEERAAAERANGPPKPVSGLRVQDDPVMAEPATPPAYEQAPAPPAETAPDEVFESSPTIKGDEPVVPALAPDPAAPVDEKGTPPDPKALQSSDPPSTEKGPS